MQRRDGAIARLVFYTRLRISELAVLDLDDAPLSARKGKVIVPVGKAVTPARSRWSIRPPGARAGRLEGWSVVLARRRYVGAVPQPARRAPQQPAIDQLVGELARDAGLVDDRGKPTIYAYSIRHTYAPT